MKSFSEFQQDTLTEGVLGRLAKRVIKPAVRWISKGKNKSCLLYTSPSPRDVEESRMPSSA